MVGPVATGLIIAGLWPQPVPVETATASVGVLRATVDEEGKTRIKQRYLVSAPVTGQLRRIPWKAGTEVRAGETVIAVMIHFRRRSSMRAAGPWPKPGASRPRRSWNARAPRTSSPRAS